MLARAITRGATSESSISTSEEEDMTKVAQNDFVARCTPEEAFEFLSDLRNELEWNPGLCLAVEKLTEGPIGPGTRYRARWKRSPWVEVEYLDYDPPRSWRAHSGGAMESHFQCSIEPHPDGARIQSELELIPHGFFKLLFPLFKRSFAKHEREAVEKMRTTLEARFGGAAAAAE